MDKIYALSSKLAKIIEHNAAELDHSITGDKLTEEQAKRLGWLGAGSLAVSQMLDMATKYQTLLAERTPHDEHATPRMHPPHNGVPHAPGQARPQAQNV